MDSKAAVFLALAAAVLILGCLGGQSGVPDSAANQPSVSSANSAQDAPVSDADLPLIDEGDSVEIGQMI